MTLKVPGTPRRGRGPLRDPTDRKETGPLVGLRRVTDAEIRAGRPIAVEMHPACRVRLRVECPGQSALEEKYPRRALRGGDWWRAAYVWLQATTTDPRGPLFTSSTTGHLEFLLPPGRYLIMAYGSDVKSVERLVEVKPGCTACSASGSSGSGTVR